MQPNKRFTRNRILGILGTIWGGGIVLRQVLGLTPTATNQAYAGGLMAGFIFGLLQGWELERQLDFACAAAALNCTCSGARGGIRTVADVEKLMANTPRYEMVSLAPAAD